MFFAKVNDFLESRTLSGESPSDLEWQGFPTPQPGKTKYSSLSQISLRINKKSSVALLVPLNPLVTSPNICCHPTLEWTLFQGLESSIPHTILWIPTCALIWILHVTIIAFILSHVRNNRVPPWRSSHVNFVITTAALRSSLCETIVSPQGSLCVNFVVTLVALISSRWKTHVTLQRNLCVNFLSAMTTVISFL